MGRAKMIPWDREPWDRDLWGIEFTSKDKSVHLIGSLWDDATFSKRQFYDGEPTRAMVFTIRKHALAWCKRQMAKYKGRTDCCADWRFRPVRVRETVRVNSHAKR